MFNMDDTGTWSLGVTIGLPLLFLLVFLLVAFGAFCCWAWRDNPDSYDVGFSIFGTFACWIVALVVIIVSLTPAGYYPFSGEYHQWREVSGTVAQIDSRLISSSDSMEDKFVVRFDGTPLQFGCDDTRCASVREGDALTLSCKRKWQFTGTDGYDCRFVKLSVN